MRRPVSEQPTDGDRLAESGLVESGSDTAVTVREAAAAALIGLADATFLPGWHLWGARARHRLQRDASPPLDGAPVLLLPGVHESPRFLDPFAALAAMHARQPHVISAFGRNVQRVTDTAELAAAYIERHDLRDVLVIAHSKGGLVGKQLMTWEQTGWRIRTMVAVATPFSGSVFAKRAPTRALRDFSPADVTLLDLATNRAANRDILSVFPAFDPQIPAGSVLPDARLNLALPVAGHFRVLAHPELWRLLRRTLREPASEIERPSRV